MRSLKLAAMLAVALCTVLACNKDKSDNTSPTITWTCTNQIAYMDSPYVFVLPTAFTPNGDGKNDAYQPIVSNFSDSGYKITIADQYGNPVFTSTNPHTGWNGRDYAGNLTTNASYAVTISFKDNNGNIVDTCTSVFIPDFGTNCIKLSASSGYVFPDQVNPGTGANAYTTQESFCP